MKKLVFNGNIYTLKSRGGKEEAIIIDNGVIQFVGSLEDCYKELETSTFESIDLCGRSLIPGFIDSHIHLIGHSEKLETIDLSSSKKKHQIIEMLKTSTNSDVIVAEGFDEQLLEGDVITKEDLDIAFRNQPVALIRVCYHTMLVNEAALHKWNVLDWDVPFTEIGRDENGKPNGYLFEGAMQKARGYCKVYTKKRLETLIETGIKDANSYGITSLVTEDLSYYGDCEETLSAFQNVINKNEFPSLRIEQLVHYNVFETIYEKGYFEKDYGSFFKLNSVKLFLDGSLGSRTAFLLNDYHDDRGNKGIYTYSVNELEEIMRNIRAKNKTVAFHIIGDAAFVMAINVLEKYPPKTHGQKDRLIHLSVITEDGLEKLHKLPVVLDLQPLFFSSDMPWVKKRLGQKRLKYSYLLASFLREGFICGGSSDSPIEDINPWRGIYSAITRKSNHDGKIYGTNEAIDLYEAICLYTKGSANTIDKAEILGKVEKDFFADFQVYEEDPFEVDIHKIPLLKPSLVFVNGEEILKRCE